MRTKATRRTTPALPSDALAQAGRIARATETSLSAHAAAKRSRQVLESYQRAFTGFSADERAILDGVMLASQRK
ncbi:MAG: hypothetical protein HY858_02695 [Candidatus Solibacter usitatus]|nr:hypothetical protein [Candidatus Solibacter usitatus]